MQGLLSSHKKTVLSQRKPIPTHQGRSCSFSRVKAISFTKQGPLSGGKISSSSVSHLPSFSSFAPPRPAQTPPLSWTCRRSKNGLFARSPHPGNLSQHYFSSKAISSTTSQKLPQNSSRNHQTCSHKISLIRLVSKESNFVRKWSSRFTKNVRYQTFVSDLQTKSLSSLSLNLLKYPSIHSPRRGSVFSLFQTTPTFSLPQSLCFSDSAAQPENTCHDQKNSSDEAHNRPVQNHDRPDSDQQTTRSNASEEDADQIGDIKEQILDLALKKYVPKYGWTTDSLANACQELGLSASSQGLFEGPYELVMFFWNRANREMIEVLNRTDLDQMTLRDRLIFILQTRLKLITPYRDSWGQALHILMLPENILSSVQELSALIDEMWYIAGDNSSQFDWYSKRVVLTGIYVSTELCMLTDQSEEYSQSWKFLERRMDDAILFSKSASEIDKIIGVFGNSVLSILSQILNHKAAQPPTSGAQNEGPKEKNKVSQQSEESVEQKTTSSAQKQNSEELQDKVAEQQEEQEKTSESQAESNQKNKQK